MKNLSSSKTVIFGILVIIFHAMDAIATSLVGHPVLPVGLFDALGAISGLLFIILRLVTHQPIDFGQIGSILANAPATKVAALMPLSSAVIGESLLPGAAPVVVPGSTPPTDRI
jgi:hypothetical protein